MRRAASLALLLTLAAGCATVGPNYSRPKTDVPDAFRGSSAAPVPSAASVADQAWSSLYVDEPLRELITTALQQNYDLRIAASRILQAQAQAGIARSNRFPTVDAQGIAQGQRTSVGTSNGEARTVGIIQLGGTLSWEPDFWGKYQRANESARAQILASEWGRRAVASTLVAEVAAGYFALRAADLDVDIATRALETRRESLRLTQVRESGGATTLVDVRQAEQLVYGATARITDLQRQIEQQENFLSVLVGRLPGSIVRGRALTEQPHAPQLPAGLPADLLERRPDIQQAEQSLVAANAEIGVARANFFPRIALTGSGGVASTALAALFSGPAAAWTAAASITQPIFNAGRNQAQLALAEARRDEATIAYQRTIQQAFREVADALVAYRRTRELRETQEQLVASARDARRLADIRYQGGASSYLEVLDSDTRLFDAENDLTQARLGELQGFVEIYRALGGGWRQ
jgi:multidrug efflux system outer membrane protein